MHRPTGFPTGSGLCPADAVEVVLIAGQMRPPGRMRGHTGGASMSKCRGAPEDATS
jgi:hypothetical protein